MGLSTCCLMRGVRAESTSLEPGPWLEKSGLVSDRALKGVLSLTRFQDEIYIVNADIQWIPKSQADGLPTVVVPRGFVTDLASVPRVFFSLFRPDGTYAAAAVVHDYLYWAQPVPRVIADRIFLEAMIDLRVSPVQRRVLFEAVAEFGEGSWKQNALLRRSGEKRVLREFPTEPDTTWAQWKAKPGVFGEL